MTRNPANISRHERELTLIVTLPRSIFATPTLSAKITIAEPAAEDPAIDISGIKRSLRSAIAADCTIEIVTRDSADD